jgi:hypothetical protein
MDLRPPCVKRRRPGLPDRFALHGEERGEFEQACRALADGEPESERDEQLQSLTDDSELLIADRRDRDTMGLFVGTDGRLTNCHATDQGDDVPPNVGLATEFGSPDGRPIPADQQGAFEVVREPGFSSAINPGGSGVAGRVDADVATLRMHLDDGRSFDATIERGHFQGWWPTRCSGRGANASRTCAPTLIAIDALDTDGDLIDRRVRDSPDQGLVPDPDLHATTPPA